MHNGFALPCPRQSNHGLPGADDLPGLGQRVHHNTVGIGEQHGITRCVPGDVSLRLRSAELCLGSIGSSFYLVIARCGNSACGDQVAIACLVIGGLLGPGPNGSDCLLLGSRLQPKVDGVEAHQRLPPFDDLSAIDQALKHLARDPKAQVTLDPSRHDAGKRSREIRRTLDFRNPHQGRKRAWIFSGG
ncbi:hypothetical protein EMIT0P228_20396 [Pseudomonas brassicacearum]